MYRKGGLVMKKLVIVLGCIFFCLLIVSCVKQKNCDCDITGKFVYFENGEEIMYGGSKCIVNAAVIPNGLTRDEGYYSRYNIVGSVPKEFRKKDTVNVSVCLKIVKSNGCLPSGVCDIYKLKCIEKED